MKKQKFLYIIIKFRLEHLKMFISSLRVLSIDPDIHVHNVDVDINIPRPASVAYTLAT